MKLLILYRGCAAAILAVLFSQSVLAQSDVNVSDNESELILETPASPRLQRVRTLIQANVLGLAQRVMEEQGPPPLPNGEWLNWERQLWSLYGARGEWQALIDRIQSIPPSFPSSVKREAETHAVDAYIALGEGARGRQLLRTRLFSDALSERDKRGLRRQVIETYIADGMLDEANAASASYQSDYRAQDNEWLQLTAELALASANPDRAVSLLAPVDDRDARILRLYARLANGSMEGAQVIERGVAMRDQEAFEERQSTLLAVMIAGAKRSSSLVTEIRLLEQYLAGEADTAPLTLKAIPTFSGLDLLETYREHAYLTANDLGFLRGEEDGWGALFSKIPETRGETRRALLATVATAAKSTQSRDAAVNQYVRELISAGREGLVHELFGDGAALGKLRLTPSTGLDLSNAAIKAGDMQLAADANATISSAPPGMDANEWLLQSGRVAIIAGRHEQGAAQLEKWLQAHPRLTPDEADSVLQPIFDLQTVDRHQLAIRLLEQVEARSPGGRHPREIAFWLAESYSATRQHVRAADYFLFSALQKDNGFDQWGESARYRAADALLEGNFFDDARTLFEGLLGRASEDARRQALMQKLQDLRLRQSSLEGDGGASPS